MKIQNQIRNVYQDEKLDAAQEKATGTAGVIIKGGQGEYQDYFEHKCAYIDDCSRVGLPWGISWQMDARYSPEKHKAALKYFADQKGFGQLGLWLACELPFYPCPTAIYQLMPYAYYKPIESVWRGMMGYDNDQAPGIYVSISKWNLIFGKCPVTLQQEFAAKAKLWVAQYKTDKPDKIGQWPDWYWWQYQENPDYSVDQPHDGEPGSVTPPPTPEPIPDPTPVTNRNAVLDEAIDAVQRLKGQTFGNQYQGFGSKYGGMK